MTPEEKLPKRFIGKIKLKDRKVNPFFIEPPKNLKHNNPLLDATEEDLKKICLKCHHTACPQCKDWCDLMLSDGSFCCNGECTYLEGHVYL